MPLKLMYIGYMFDPESEGLGRGVGANNHSPSDVSIMLELIEQFDYL